MASILLVLFHSSKGSLVDIKMLRFRQATVDRPYGLCRITASTQPRNTDQIWENCRMKEKMRGVLFVIFYGHQGDAHISNPL
jgi:hypothetical protein